MRKKTRLCSVGSLLILILCLPLLKGEKINLSSSSAASTIPQIVVDSAGRILVVWAEEEQTSAAHDIFYSTFVDSVWSLPQKSFSRMDDSQSPHMVIDTGDKGHLVFDDGEAGSQRSIFYRTYAFSDGFWSNPERVFLGKESSRGPKLAADSTGRPYVMWVEGLEGAPKKIVLSQKNDLGEWAASFEEVSTDSSSAAAPAFQVKNGNVYACWVEDRDGGSRLSYREKIDGQWQPPLRQTIPENTSWPVLVLDHDGTVHILFWAQNEAIFYIQKQGQSWGAPLLVSSAPSPAGALDLKLFKNNILYAVWRQTADSGVVVVHARGRPDGRWTSPVVVAASTQAENPRIGLDQEGTAHVVWQDSGLDGNGDVFYSPVSFEGSKPAVVLDISDDTGIAPATIDCDASGSVSNGEEIISTWWDMGDGSDMVQSPRLSHTYEKPGTFLVRVYVTNSLLRVGVASKTIHILSGPFPPVKAEVRTLEEGGLFARQKINVLTWEGDPRNSGRVTLSHYNIYRRKKNPAGLDFTKIAQVSAGSSQYVDRNFVFLDNPFLFDYGVSAVDTQGREGPLRVAGSASTSGAVRTSHSSGRRRR